MWVKWWWQSVKCLTFQLLVETKFVGSTMISRTLKIALFFTFNAFLLSYYEIWLFHTAGSCSWLLTTQAWLDLRAVHVESSTATPQLSTNLSHNQIILKNILCKTSIKMTLKFNFELSFFSLMKKLCSYCCTTERLLAGVRFSVPESVYSSSFLIFNLWPIWLNYHVVHKIFCS
jgi:hypothetical protein